MSNNVVSLRVQKGPATTDRELGIVFEPIDGFVYQGGQLLGRYSRIGVRRIATFDAHGLWLGDYSASKKARHAICKRCNLTKHSVEIFTEEAAWHAVMGPQSEAATLGNVGAPGGGTGVDLDRNPNRSPAHASNEPRQHAAAAARK